MPRPRLHSLDDLLDVAEDLVVHGDPAGLTLRTLAEASGSSNGTIYHAFGSKEELLARLWLRATARLGSVFEESLEDTSGLDAVVAAALAPLVFARRHPSSAQLFFAQRSDQLFTPDLPAELNEALAAGQKRFRSLLAGLARDVWDRADRRAVEAVATCVVDLPGGIVRRALLEGRTLDAAAERRLEAAVRAVLAVPLEASRSTR